jgi:hypothetical protein
MMSEALMRRIYIQVCMCVCVLIIARTYRHTCLHPYMYTYIHIHMIFRNEDAFPIDERGRYKADMRAMGSSVPVAPVSGMSDVYGSHPDNQSPPPPAGGGGGGEV